MEQLAGLDAAFLAMETPTVFGHVGSVCVLDPSTSPEPFTFERFTRLIESRLPLVPPFRRRLVEVPLGLDQPYWIEDPDFDIEFHVRELALPAPGSDAQLAEQVARLHARPLDRSRPLWEIYLIWGLQGDRVAVYTKVHHAAIDGVSGNEILSGILDLSPEGRPPLDLPTPAPPTGRLLTARARPPAKHHKHPTTRGKGHGQGNHSRPGAARPLGRASAVGRRQARGTRRLCRPSCAPPRRRGPAPGRG
jgi:diacylglycerol O-acyltransferase